MKNVEQVLAKDNIFKYLSNSVWLLDIAKKTVLSLLILIIGWIIIKKVVNLLESAFKLKGYDKGVISFMSSLFSNLLKVLLIFSVASMMGIETTSFVAIITAVAFSVGMALQGSLSNFAGGVMILLFKPFKFGDYIDASGLSGTVSAIKIFHTHLTTPDNIEIIIPNGTLSNGSVTNYSAHPTRRLDITIGLDYKTPIESTKKILMDIIVDHKMVLKDPEPFVRLTNMGNNSLDMTIRVYVQTENYWELKFDLLESIKISLDKACVFMACPFPPVVRK